MNERRGRALRGPDRRSRRARRSSPRCARRAAIARHGALRAHRPVLAPLRRADRAAHLAAVVHAHGRARRGRRSTPCASGRVRIHPERQARRYLDWLENIRPWCISRQLWWGHQIPVWYRGEETYVGLEPPEGEGWERDPDVLDTWFSSGLWPFATLGWPEQTRRSCARSTRPTCSRRRATSCSCGSRAW